MPERWKIITLPMMISIVAIAIGMWIWFKSPLAVYSGSETIDPFEEGIQNTIYQNMSDYDMWYRLNLVVQILIIVSGFFSAILAALTSKDNAEQMKYYLITFTTISSILALCLSTFRVQENMEIFAETHSDLMQLQYNYISDRSSLADKLQALNEKGNRHMPPEVLAIQAKHLKEYNRIVARRMKAWANIGKKGLPSTTEIPINPNPSKPQG